MADVKPTEVPATLPVTEPVVPETAPAETTAAAPVEETPAVAETTTEETPAAEPATDAAAAPAEEAKKEVKPIEEGSLKHKAAPASFPDNFIYAKNHFWFGSEATPKDKLTHFKTDKATDVAHYVIAWAGETGKGLLFYGKDAKTPTGAIPLAEATEPTVDGPTKFIVHAKGHKHTFKSANAAERDNWVAQLKLKIAEAKELATTVTESEGFKKTVESFKPTPIVKKEATPAPVVAAETPAETPAATEAVATETPAVEEPKAVDTKPAFSKKRNSLFGGLSFGKKEEAKKEEKAVAATEETPATEPTAEAAPAVEEPVAPVEPITETPAVEAAAETPAAEATPAAEVKPETKPTPSKRSSIFGNLSFGKKKAEGEAAPVTPAKEAEPVPETAPIAETAPVIPPVETEAPLSTEVASTLPTDTVDATPATNGETKKDVKSEKRKSSLPFAFGKKEKSPASDEEGEKKSSGFSFGKLRQTVKGKKSEKVTEKPAATEPAAEEKAAEPAAATEPETVEATPAVEETKPEVPAAATTVSAAA